MERQRLDDLRREQQRIEAELRTQAQQQARTPAPRPQPAPPAAPPPAQPAPPAAPPPAQPAPSAAQQRAAIDAALNVSQTEAQRAAAQQSEVVRQAIIDKIEAALLADDFQEAERLRGFLP